MCKIEVDFCGGTDEAEHVQAMIAGLEDAASIESQEDDLPGLNHIVGECPGGTACRCDEN